MSYRLPPAPLQRIIGLTGGVGMGKTTVSNYLETAYQLAVLDADLFARAAVEPNSPILAEIIERYGASLLQPDQTLDRARLAQIVFSRTSERLWIEQRIHPFVRDRLSAGLEELAAQGETIAVLVVPLLFEARMTDLVTEIWVVQSSLEQQIERLRQRDRASLEQVLARIDSQMPIERKLDRADRVIENDSTLEALLAQVDRAVASAPDRSGRITKPL